MICSIMTSFVNFFTGKILPVVKRQHLLLCTLLIGNALAMEVRFIEQKLVGNDLMSFGFNFCIVWRIML